MLVGLTLPVLRDVLRFLACKADHYTALKQNRDDESKMKCIHVVELF